MAEASSLPDDRRKNLRPALDAGAWQGLAVRRAGSASCSVPPKSPRNIAPEALARPRRAPLAAQQRPISWRSRRCRRCDCCDDHRARYAPDWIQLHGSERPRRVAECARSSRARGVIKALGDRAARAISRAPQPTSRGRNADVRRQAPAGRPARRQCARVRLGHPRRPAFLAGPGCCPGGLTPENVPEAIAPRGAGARGRVLWRRKRPGPKGPRTESPPFWRPRKPKLPHGRQARTCAATGRTCPTTRAVSAPMAAATSPRR